MLSKFKVFTGEGQAPIKAWIENVPVEEQAIEQLRRTASLPFIFRHVAAMPDVHLGKGSTIGSVIATQGAIVPAAVGVDIGCGMIAVQTSLKATDLPDDLGPLRSQIEKDIPHGRSDNGGRNDKGSWSEAPSHGVQALEALAPGLKAICLKHPEIGRAAVKSATQMGTLGGGNHFVEVCLDEEQRVWIMLHSGSRGIGNRIGTYFIEKAQAEMRRWFINLPDKDLAYLAEGSELFNDYCEAVDWAQQYAAANRVAMMAAALTALSLKVPKRFAVVNEAINCHHNYVTRENHFGSNVFVTRKGAVQARKGTLGIIPGSMGAKSFIVCGKGHAESFCSCSHGAGRVMSRNEARKRYSLEDHVLATTGVECRKDTDVIDETPAAYKSIEAVMAAQADLVDVVHTLKQVLCVKG